MTPKEKKLLMNLSLTSPLEVRGMLLSHQEAQFMRFIKEANKRISEAELSLQFSISREHALNVIRRMYNKGYLLRERSNKPNNHDKRDKWLYYSAI
jgi:DNA-binding MarR family transcriptional regulator